MGRWGVKQHARERLPLRARGVRENGGDAGERLVGFRVEHVQDRAGEQGVGCGLPVVARLLLAGRVDEDVGDVLGVAHLREALADLEQRIEAHRIHGRRLEPPRPAELPPPPRRQRPVLLLDVVDEHRVRPGEERRDDEAHALAAARGGKAEDVLGAVVAYERSEAGGAGAGLARRIDGRSELGVVRLAEDDARVAQQARALHLRGRRPARAAVGAATGRGLAAQGRHGGRAGTGQGRRRR